MPLSGSRRAKMLSTRPPHRQPTRRRLPHRRPLRLRRAVLISLRNKGGYVPAFGFD